MFFQQYFTRISTLVLLSITLQVKRLGPRWHMSSSDQVFFVLGILLREACPSLRSMPGKVFIWKPFTISWQPIFMRFSRCLEGLHYFQSRSHASLFMASARAPFTHKNSHRNGPHPAFSDCKLFWAKAKVNMFYDWHERGVFKAVKFWKSRRKLLSEVTGTNFSHWASAWKWVHNYRV